MTQADRDMMRAYFGSPEGRRTLDEINRAYYSRLAAQAREEASFWRPSPPGSLPYPPDAEVSNEIPPDSSRTFRPAHARQARRVSYWPLIIAAMICTVACAGLIGLFVASALRVRA